MEVRHDAHSELAPHTVYGPVPSRRYGVTLGINLLPHAVGVLEGLGLLPGSNCPHYSVRRDAYMGALRGGLAPGLAAEDGVAMR